MRWTPGGMSPDIEDRRGEPGGGGGFGGFGGIRLGIGGTLLLLLLSVVFRVNLLSLFTGEPPSQVVRPSTEADRSAEAREVPFVSFVLDDVQSTWDRILPTDAGVNYPHAKLVLFRDYIQSG